MTATVPVLKLLIGCIPIYSAIVWTAMTGMSVYDSNTEKERTIKRIAMFFYIFTIGVWVLTMTYTYLPAYSLYMHIPGYFCLLAVPVQLYRFICVISETPRKKPFSMWHYAIPVGFPAILAIWSLFVPVDVQLFLLEGRALPVADYRAYSWFFLLKPSMRLLFTLVYTVLCVIRLSRYYKEINDGRTDIRQPARWITTLMLFALSILLITVVSFFCPREQFVKMTHTAFLIIFLAGEHLIIGYNVIRRNFLLYVPGKVDPRATYAREVDFAASSAANNTNNGAKDSKNRRPAVKLTKNRFERYMYEQKPWKSPRFRITDITGPLCANRTSISGFINSTYGMNFNRYINRLRIAEVERLKKNRENSGKSDTTLALQAGFASKRNYTRALETEQANCTRNNDRTGTKNNKRDE